MNIVKTPIVLLLITPSLTPFLENGNPAIPNLLRKVFSRPLQAQTVDVLAVVVDRIPFPPESVLKGTGIGQEQAAHGSEGISVLIADSKQIAPALWSTNLLDKCSEDLGDGKVSFLSFQFSSKDALDVSQNIKKPATIYTVDLPLANTIFQNGKTSTMIAQQWSFDSNTEHLIRRKHTFLHQQNLFIPSAEGGSEKSINVPLFRKLTAPRTITESMGNIIRRLRISHDSLSTMPASEELEQSLEAWTSTQINAHEIWARLTPRERWSGLPEIFGNPSEVERGSRLHKVLSGGGGWGVKQGLISLDPNSKLGSPSVQSVFGDGEDVEREQYDVFGEIARPGDSIQFYAFEQSSLSRPFKLPKAMNISAPHTITFGNIGSQQDAMPNTVPTESSDLGPLFIHGHFGALCESGISLDIKLSLEDATSYGSQKMGTVVHTKLPPLSSFCWKANKISTVSMDEAAVTVYDEDTNESKIQLRRGLLAPVTQ
ncbi:hypothetical protein MMC11_001734 [Xylographa trunciseda]|nr:hypothetical protein [Xylographa trunciseda]